MLVTRKSNYSGIVRTKEINCTQKQLDEWERGTLIQKAMPHLSASDREFIMTGMTDDEWKEMCSDIEDDES